MCFEETVNDGVGRMIPGHGVVSHCPPPPPVSHGGSIRETVSIVLIYIFSFENPWRLLARCWNGKKYS